MVVTKVIQIKGVASLSRSTKYIEDEAKTMELNDAKSLKNALHYIENESKTLISDSEFEFPTKVKDGRLVSQLVSTYGIVDAETATEEFLMTKKNAAQRQGTKELSDITNPNRVLAHHIIQSFSPEDDLSPQEIHEIGRKTVLELTGGQHEFVIATHMDKGHIHNHIIFNSTNYVTMNKFRWQKGTKKSLERISDKHADLAGAKILKEKMWSNRKSYGAYQKKNIFKSEIKSRLNFLLKHSTSLEDFKVKAQTLNLSVDFSGKEVKYRLLDELDGKRQERNTRDRTLSKKGNYSKAAIEERVGKNEATIPLENIKTEYEKFREEQEQDFEMKIRVEDWQVLEETKTGIYIEMEFGLRNKGVIQIPAHQVEKVETGGYDIFIKKTDWYYFTNPEHAEQNKFMRGMDIAAQLSYDNGEMIVTKNPHISELDQLVREFNFLSAHGVSDGQQFDNLLERFEEEFEAVEQELSKLDNRLGELNKIQSALLGLESDNPYEVSLAQAILEEMAVHPSTSKREIDKFIKEVTFERAALRQRVQEITKNYNMRQEIERNIEQRKEGALEI
ncbi:hypothetical protein STRDD10_00404 [Streptococcus sp. DD10]|uniref:helical hairpin domain-containing protein n=1 Tax=Streptococcus sp. DD10 TaxID=1777878 RepID=UPI0007911909|nr:relaxase/mobilization nuclease domain-containing protein [Streptococcus sp. DD10]KXT75168.1 hypothetical protein STRDD10_00404 [Streptococcus sp. DD10]